jgi:flagellar secretion chaperone FliS
MMKRSETQRSYQMSAIQGASPIGLMVVLFDRLADDLRRAATALRKNDIETRCTEFNHASLVLGQMENWIDMEKGGESAQALTSFYANLRAKMMEAGATNSPQLLETQIDTLVDVRSAWQQLDTGPPEVAKTPAPQMTTPSERTFETKVERIPFSESG